MTASYTEADLADAAIAWTEIQPIYREAQAVSDRAGCRSILERFSSLRSVFFSAHIARKVLPIWDKYQPNDDSPKRAIEAAEMWLSDYNDCHRAADAAEAAIATEIAAAADAAIAAGINTCRLHDGPQSAVMPLAAAYARWRDAAHATAYAAAYAAYAAYAAAQRNCVGNAEHEAVRLATIVAGYAAMATSWDVVRRMLSEHVAEWVGEDWIASVVS
jgi:hypothetical protein